MPNEMSGLPHDLRKDMGAIPIAIGSRKDKDADIHRYFLLIEDFIQGEGVVREERIMQKGFAMKILIIF